MNGRVYDPELGRFMSADPFVQAPYNSQSYNRYSYVFNNPLSFTDPSGYLTSDYCPGNNTAVCKKDKKKDEENEEPAPEELLVEGNQEQHLRRMSAVDQSNIAGWRATEDHGEKWAYTNGAAYNVNSYWGVMLYSLAAGGYGANGNGNDALNQNLSSELNRLQGLIEWGNDPRGAHAWAIGHTVNEHTKIAGAIALSPLAIYTAGTSTLTATNYAGRIASYIARLPTGKPFTSIKDFGRYLIGKPYPTRVGYMGRQQPYNPEKGRYLSFSANPGFANSPLGRFGAGVGQGITEGASRNGTPPGYGLGRAGGAGYEIGKFIGGLF